MYLFLGLKFLILYEPIPVAAGSKAGICGRSLAGIMGANPAGALMSVYCERCVLSGRVLCVGLITRPGELVCLNVIVKPR